MSDLSSFPTFTSTDSGATRANPLAPSEIAAPEPASPPGASGAVTSFLNLTSGLASAPGNLIGNALPASVRSPFAEITGMGNASAPKIDPAYQRNMSALSNKYAELRESLAGVDPKILNALIDMDSKRVANGSAPLTRQQTLLAIQAATTNKQATPEAERNPMSLWDNIKSDASDILKAIPRIPLALFNEAKDLPNIDKRISEAQANGANIVQAIAQAPGVRMLPGAYVAGNLAGGASGIRDLAQHPLMTFLDVLPGASKAAGATRVGKVAAEAAELAGRKPRPLTALMTGKVVPDAATGADTLGRNALGRTIDYAKTNTRPGQLLDSAFGRTNREVAKLGGRLDQRLSMFAQGHGTAAIPEEALLARVKPMFDKHAQTHPELNLRGPDGEAWRAQLVDDFTRGDTAKYDPAFVAEYRQILDDIGKHAAQEGIVAEFRGELYDPQTAARLRASQARADLTRRGNAARTEYLNPTGQLDAAQLRTMAAEFMAEPLVANQSRGASAMIHTLDAYGVDVSGVQSTLRKAQRAKAADKPAMFAQVAAEFDALLANPSLNLAPRRGITEVIAELRKYSGKKSDRQVTKLEVALMHGKRGEATAAIKNLQTRKPPKFPAAQWPQLQEDIASLGRRMEFDEKVGKRWSDKRVQSTAKSVDKSFKNAAPARFDALLGDEFKTRLAKEGQQAKELTLGRQLTADEAAHVTRAVNERRWEAALPHMDVDTRNAFMSQIEREVKATWQDLKNAGHDPIFVHKVHPDKAFSAFSGKVGPVPIKASQGKERALDLSPAVGDLQVSLTHQASELLQAKYRETYAQQIIDAVGIPEDVLRAQLSETARWRQSLNPSAGFEGHLQQEMKRGYKKFNPDEDGHSWGGTKLDKYRAEESVWIPLSVADQLKRLTAPPSIISTALDPVTNAFRYNVIGLSPGVIVNNFFSNAVAMMAKSGPTPFQYWRQAREWLADPSKIPSDELRAMILAENPAHPALDRGAWLKTRAGEKFMGGFNAGQAFRDSAAYEAMKRGKSAMDGIVEKSLKLQQLGDNIYRAMIYMDEMAKGTKKGLAADAAEKAALEMVQSTLVDFSSFTAIERSAIRSIIPFYSYMGHAARFITRYPLDHPVRASIASHLAAAEKERLGSLPGSFLSMLPIGGVDGAGKQLMVPLRPFDPFGDISDMMSLSGWMAATNPLISTALQEVGVARGESELYPTMRYDPESGRMKPVHGGFFGNLMANTVPRAMLPLTPLGLNSTYNELAASDPAAAARSLLTSAGIPRMYREVNVPQEKFRAEIARQQAANTVKNEALKSGDWSEALRYPSLRDFYTNLNAAAPEALAAFTPAEQSAIAQSIKEMVGTE